MTTRTKANENFTENQENRKARYLQLADENRELANNNDNWKTSLKQSEKANYYKNKASGVGKGGIMSDDPQAITLLKQKIERLEGTRDHYKLVNKCINSTLKKYKNVEKKGMFGDSWKIYDHEKIKENRTELKIMLVDKILKAKLTLHGDFIDRLLDRPDYDSGCYGYATYTITSQTTRIREAKKRLKFLEEQEEKEPINFKAENVEVIEEDGRVNVYFDSIPEKELRTKIKSYPISLKWSPSRECWTRKRTQNVGQYFLDALRKALNVE